MAARVVPVDAFDLVIVGGTGDLARRKLIPALYHRMRDGQMPPDARVIGAARSCKERDEYRKYAAEALEASVAPTDLDGESRDRFLECMDYVALDVDANEGWQELSERLPVDSARPRAYYLSVAPSLFAPVAARLAEAGLAAGDARVVVEKPLGRDLATAMALNLEIARYFDERHIYRIDHYLGKETVQNLMALRFANALFEPLWNARHVDHVQITVAESLGVDGRGAYYDSMGAMRDMVQNHLLQLLCLVAMEPPYRFEPDVVRDEKLKVLRALAPLSDSAAAVRGQYGSGVDISSYLDDVGCEKSRTESFVAVRTEVENWRWSGVPFYLRTGKRLRSRVSEIAIVFREPPHSIFPDSLGGALSNTLAIRLQPDEGIKLSMTVKETGPGGLRLAPAQLDMTFADTMGDVRMPDAYERLVMDVMRGDQTLFMRFDEVEAAWQWIDPIIADWEERSDRPIVYDPGSSGPEDALMLMHRDGRRWREIVA